MEKVTAPVQEPGVYISRKELHELTVQKTQNEIRTLQMLNRKNISLAKNEAAFTGYIYHSNSVLSEQVQVDKLLEMQKEMLLLSIKELKAKNKFVSNKFSDIK